MDEDDIGRFVPPGLTPPEDTLAEESRCIGYQPDIVTDTGPVRGGGTTLDTLAARKEETPERIRGAFGEAVA